MSFRMVGKRKPRYELNRDKFLSSSELESFEVLLARSLKNPDNRRDVLLLLLALHTGGRAQEILNLKVTDFDFSNGTVYLRGLKGSSCREIPLPRWVSKQLRVYTMNKYPLEKIFPITYNRFRQIWLMFRPAKKKLHSLRHTFAIRTYQNTRDVKLLQMALGHRSLINTMVYLDYLYSIRELQRLIQPNEGAE